MGLISRVSSRTYRKTKPSLSSTKMFRQIARSLASSVTRQNALVEASQTLQITQVGIGRPDNYHNGLRSQVKIMSDAEWDSFNENLVHEAKTSGPKEIHYGGNRTSKYVAK